VEKEKKIESAKGISTDIRDGLYHIRERKVSFFSFTTWIWGRFFMRPLSDHGINTGVFSLSGSIQLMRPLCPALPPGGADECW
jgi:hypothetical protein